MLQRNLSRSASSVQKTEAGDISFSGMLKDRTWCGTENKTLSVYITTAEHERHRDPDV